MRLCSSLRRRRRRGVLALLAEFAHDLCDVNGAAGGQLGLLLLLHLPEDDGAETGPPVLCILLQLGITAVTRRVDPSVLTTREVGERRRGAESKTDRQREEEGGKDKMKIEFWK